MIKNRFVAIATGAAVVVMASGAAMAAYQTPATTVLSSTVNQQSSTTTSKTLNAGIQSSGGGSNMFRGGRGPSTSSLLDAGAKGFSAQGNEPRFGVWGQYGYTIFDEDQSAIDSDGKSHTVAFGGDYRFNRWLIGGLALAYERTDVDTTFNLGKLDQTGYVVAPYAVFALIQNRLFLDVSAGYVFGDQDTERNSGRIRGSTDTSRIFGAANLTASLEHKNWNFRPGTGILWSRSQSEAYRESNATAVPKVVDHFGRMRLGTEVGYQFAKWEPFVMADYTYDYKFDYAKVGAGQIQPKEHRSAATFGLGANIALTNSLTGSLRGTTEAFRKDNSQQSFTGSMRYAF